MPVLYEVLKTQNNKIAVNCAIWLDSLFTFAKQAHIVNDARCCPLEESLNKILLHNRRHPSKFDVVKSAQ